MNAAVVGGAMDPVRIPAETGDTIELTASGILGHRRHPDVKLFSAERSCPVVAGRNVGGVVIHGEMPGSLTYAGGGHASLIHQATAPHGILRGTALVTGDPRALLQRVASAQQETLYCSPVDTGRRRS